MLKFLVFFGNGQCAKVDTFVISWVLSCALTGRWYFRKNLFNVSNLNGLQLKGSKQNVEVASIAIEALETKRSLHHVRTTLETKSLSQLDCEMTVRMAKFNVKIRLP
jgi:hypothetical protein